MSSKNSHHKLSEVSPDGFAERSSRARLDVREGKQGGLSEYGSRRSLLLFLAGGVTVFVFGLLLGYLLFHGQTVDVASSPLEPASATTPTTLKVTRALFQDEAAEHCVLSNSLGMLEALVTRGSGLKKSAHAYVRMSIAGGEPRQTGYTSVKTQDPAWYEKMYICVPRVETDPLNLRGKAEDWELKVELLDSTFSLFHPFGGHILGETSYSIREVMEASSLKATKAFQLAQNENGKKTGATVNTLFTYIPLGRENAGIVTPKCDDPQKFPADVEVCSMVTYSVATVVNNVAFTMKDMDASAKLKWLTWADTTSNDNFKQTLVSKQHCHEMANTFFCAATYQQCDGTHDGVNGYGLPLCQETCAAFFKNCYTADTADFAIQSTCNNYPKIASGRCTSLELPLLDDNPPTWQEKHANYTFKPGSLPGVEATVYFRPPTFRKPVLVGVRNIIPHTMKLDLEISLKNSLLTVKLNHGKTSLDLDWWFRLLGFPGFHDSFTVPFRSASFGLQLTAKVVKNNASAIPPPRKAPSASSSQPGVAEVKEADLAAYSAEVADIRRMLDAGPVSVAYASFEGQSYSLQTQDVKFDLDFDALFSKVYRMWFKGSIVKLVEQKITETVDLIGAAVLEGVINATPENVLVNYFGMNGNDLAWTMKTSFDFDYSKKTNTGRRLAGLGSNAADAFYEELKNLKWTVEKA